METACFHVGFAKTANTIKLIDNIQILHIIGEEYPHPNIFPHKAHGINSSGLHTPNEETIAWLSLYPKYPKGQPKFTIPSTIL